MELEELVRMLVCPACRGPVRLVKPGWLACDEPGCQRRYPIREGVPVMLVEEGDRYAGIPVEQLGDPGTLGR